MKTIRTRPPTGAGALALLLLMSFTAPALASPVEVTFTALRAKCEDCDTTSGPDIYLKLKGSTFTDARMDFQENAPDTWFVPTTGKSTIITIDSDDGRFHGLEIEFWEEDDTFNGSDDEYDITQGVSGKSVQLTLDMETFTWKGFNGTYCQGVDCTFGKAVSADGEDGLEWAIEFNPIEVCDGIDNDGNGLIDDGTGSCMHRVLFIPMCWNGTQTSFDALVETQRQTFLNATGTQSCDHNIQFVTGNVGNGFCPPCSGALSGVTDTTTDSSGNTRLAVENFNPADFDKIVAATDIDYCDMGGGNNPAGATGGGVIWAEINSSIRDIVYTHEWGHNIGLADEYCSSTEGGELICTGPGDVNPLDPALGCDPDGDCCDTSFRNAEWAGGTDDDPCLDPDGTPGYNVCCRGNLAAHNPPGDMSNGVGRCMMANLAAPGPRGFCRHCWNQMKSVGFDCAAIFQSVGNVVNMQVRVDDDGFAFLEGGMWVEPGRTGYIAGTTTTDVIVELRDSSGALIKSLNTPSLHSHDANVGELGHDSFAFLRFPVDASVTSSDVLLLQVRDTVSNTIVSQMTFNGVKPVADAGPASTEECNNGVGTIQLDASGSFDADGDSLTYKWISSATAVFDDDTAESPTVTLPLGAHLVLVTVSDGIFTDQATVVVSVTDTIAPVLTLPDDLMITACGAPSIGDASAVDACGVSSVVSDLTPPLLLGDTDIVWTVTDLGGNTATGSQTVTAMLGDDVSCCPAGTNIIVGTSGDDHLDGTDGDDCILGLDGDDLIHAKDGNDVISGGLGDVGDHIHGGKDNDIIFGWGGDDHIHGDKGNDVIYGQDGDDHLHGDDGNDELYGGNGDDEVDGDDDDDLVCGGPGNDELKGGSGVDTLLGDEGDDKLKGGSGDDTLEGGDGFDDCDGNGGNNTCVCEEIDASDC